MKTTYVVRDGKVVEKAGPMPDEIRPWALSEHFVDWKRFYGARDEEAFRREYEQIWPPESAS